MADNNNNNNLRDVPMVEGGVVAHDKITVGHVKQALANVADDAVVVIPFSVFGEQVEELQLASVLIGDGGTVVGFEAISTAEYDMMKKLAEGDYDDITADLLAEDDSPLA